MSLNLQIALSVMRDCCWEGDIYDPLSNLINCCFDIFNYKFISSIIQITLPLYCFLKMIPLTVGITSFSGIKGSSRSGDF